jgi:hypothetical protein
MQHRFLPSTALQIVSYVDQFIRQGPGGKGGGFTKGTALRVVNILLRTIKLNQCFLIVFKNVNCLLLCYLSINF